MRLLIIAGLFSGFFISCKEKGPAIDFSDVRATDTVYTASVETAQPKIVLLEEFTGVTCPNCPQAHQAISGFQGQYPGRVIAVGYYAHGMAQTKPIEGLTIQDFRNDKATELGNNFFGGVPFLPSGTIDRIPDNDQYLYQSNKWGGILTSRISLSSPVNLYVTGSYDADEQQATALVKMAFTADVNRQLSLTLLVVENDIIDAQEYGLRIDTFYKHAHVMRDIITPNAGMSILDSIAVKPAGLVYERNFTFAVDPSWKAENCQVVAFVSYNEPDSKEVVQAAEAHLIP